MSTYSRFIYESDELSAPILPDVDVESIVDDNEIEKAYEDSALESAFRVMAENTQNWNSILEACTITEFCYLEENGQEMVYEGDRLDSFLSKAKEFFQNIWKKIQEIFKNAVMQFNSWFQADKEFIKKYEKDITAARNSKAYGDKEISIYKFPMLSDPSKDWVDGLDATVTGVDFSNAKDVYPDYSDTTEGDAALEALKKCTPEKEAEYYDKVRAEVIGGSDKEVTSAEFGKLCKEKLYGNNGDKADVKLSVAISEAVEFLKKSDSVKKALNDALKTNKKGIDDTIKSINEMDKQLNKNLSTETSDANKKASADHSLATKLIGVNKTLKNIAIQFNGECIQALKACSRQCKAVCVKAVTYKVPKNESAIYQTESSMSLLDQLVLQ